LALHAFKAAASGQICGQRYRAREALKLDGQSDKLNRTYRVKVIEPAGGVAKAALTPIAVAADGVLMLGGAIVLLPVFVLLVVSNGFWR